MTLALVFPGHGSQVVGMLDSLSARPEVNETIQEASDVTGKDVGKLISEGPAELFHSLPFAAIATVTMGVACYRAWSASCNYKPSIVAGHSHGEYSALVAAGVISFKDALSIVHYRAKRMEEIHGGMGVIIGLSAAKAVELCAQVSEATGKTVEPANFNAPGKVLIAGDKEAVAAAIVAADTAGAKFTRSLLLPIPAHSSFLDPVAEKLRDYFKDIEFRSPTIPIINNVDVAMLDNPADIKDAMARQVSKPVRWHEIIKSMTAQGIRTIVECGPGNVLHELNPRIDSNIRSMAFMDEQTLSEVIQNLN